VTARTALLALALLVGATAPARADQAPAPTPGPAAIDAGEVIELLPLQTADRRIIDAAGRDVLLRGANVNSLGEYWQGVPAIAPTIPVTDADWDAMAARGFSVVRLLITWSRVEPTRDVIDEAYLDQLDAAVTAAAERGIYTVIDMHQDAYSAHTATVDPATCPPGTSPARGWDGAPAWAVRTDGLSTCLTSGDRNSSPAVTRAWNNFYDDVDGIRAELVEAWATVAARFAGRPEVAGYDILNEPEVSRPAAELQPLYDQFVADVVDAIRAAEAAAPFDHLVFVEPAIPAGNPAFGIVVPNPASTGTSTANVVAAAHNYAESILVGLTIEQLNDVFESLGAVLGVPQWTGEYGFWSTDAATLERVQRYAADEDRRAWGGAWWQWRQSCGDPHAVRWDGDEVVSHDGTEVQLNLLDCPGNVDLGPNDAFLDVLGRGYPRAAPGSIDELVSDPATGRLLVRATATAAGGELVVWTPTADDPEHRVVVEGLVDVRQHAVPGGRIVTARVVAPGAFQLEIAPGAAAPTEPPVPPAPPAAPAPPADPVTAPATYAG
jgi:endoglycosylceramidase